MNVVDGGAYRVDGVRLNGMWLGTLDGMAWVLTRAGISHSGTEGKVVRHGSSTLTFGTDFKYGLATLTPVGWWGGRQLGPHPSA